MAPTTLVRMQVWRLSYPQDNAPAVSSVDFVERDHGQAEVLEAAVAMQPNAREINRALWGRRSKRLDVNFSAPQKRSKSNLRGQTLFSNTRNQLDFCKDSANTNPATLQFRGVKLKASGPIWAATSF